MVAGTTSAVNLTDGLDGLAAGCATIVLLAYIGITFITAGQHDLALLSGCLVGACVGFLWYNAFPATIFMGDTGSLGLGGAIAGLAVMTKTEELLVLLGGIFVVEALSVIIQVASFQAFRKRVFLMAPDPPPLRADGLVGDEDHPAVLDHRLGLRGHRVHDLPAVDWVRAVPPLPPGPYLVVGLARSGIAAARALRARGEDVVAVDSGRPEADLGPDVTVHLATDGLAELEHARAVVKSPGVPREAPVVAAARERGIPVLGELELGWRLVPNEVVAVTGTNGKTTTVELLGAIHREAGLPVAVAGNVGTALSSLAGELGPDAVVVCEASSFQLEDALDFAPEGAVLLNATPDHLDRHGTFEDYLAAKLRIFARQSNDDVAVAPAHLGVEDLGGCARRVLFGAGPEAELSERAGQLWWADVPLMRVDEVRMRGRAQRPQRDGGRSGRARARRGHRRGAHGARHVRRGRAPPRDGRRRTAESSTSTTPRRPTWPARSSRWRRSTRRCT